MGRPIRVVAMLTLEFSLDNAQVTEAFNFWTRNIQPLLGSAYSLGVVGEDSAIITPTLDTFQEAMKDSVKGGSAKEYEAFASDRANRILRALDDPEIAAIWIFNGGAVTVHDRSDTIKTMRSVVKALKHQIPDFDHNAGSSAESDEDTSEKGEERSSPKPMLGYCYGTAIMAILGLVGKCRPIHAPLGREIPAYSNYPPEICSSQLLSLCDAIRGDLSTVTFPSGLEVHNRPAARFASGQVAFQGVIAVGLVQILHSIMTGYLPPRTHVILIIELLDFGDEFDLLMNLAELHAKDALCLQMVFFGHQCVKEPARYAKLHEVRHQMMILCPLVPFLGGLPVGHDKPNFVVPFGWGTVRCDPMTGQTSITYHRNDHPLPGVPAGFMMLPPNGQSAPNDSGGNSPFKPATNVQRLTDMALTSIPMSAGSNVVSSVTMTLPMGALQPMPCMPCMPTSFQASPPTSYMTPSFLPPAMNTQMPVYPATYLASGPAPAPMPPMPPVPAYPMTYSYTSPRPQPPPQIQIPTPQQASVYPVTYLGGNPPMPRPATPAASMYPATYVFGSTQPPAPSPAPAPAPPPVARRYSAPASFQPQPSFPVASTYHIPSMPQPQGTYISPPSSPYGATYMNGPIPSFGGARPNYMSNYAGSYVSGTAMYSGWSPTPQATYTPGYTSSTYASPTTSPRQASGSGAQSPVRPWGCNVPPGSGAPSVARPTSTSGSSSVAKPSSASSVAKPPPAASSFARPMPTPTGMSVARPMPMPISTNMPWPLPMGNPMPYGQPCPPPFPQPITPQYYPNYPTATNIQYLSDEPKEDGAKKSKGIGALFAEFKKELTKKK